MQCDGPSLLRALEGAGARLAAHVDEVNALNVYPVPDGDTGTNMLHTVSSALAAARASDPAASSLAAALAHGALMGARGNSGVILSQVLRGLKDALDGRAALDAAALRSAIALGRRHAFAAVTHPAPGTMLTALEAIEAAVTGGSAGTVLEVLTLAVESGRKAVGATREQNPTNRAAGVIDAGAHGLWLLLDGALSVLDGHADTAVRLLAPVTKVTVGDAPDWEGAYDVQFLVMSPSRSAADVRKDMLQFGADCVLVVGDESAIKVHVHTLEPHEIIRIGLSAGRVSDVVVEDLDAMSEEHERLTGIVVHSPPRPLALVTVVPGDGFAEAARALGAVPLRGGATMNPSTEELLAAIRSANAVRTILLPNDRNVILAARQAATLHDGVTVVATQNLAQGMAALVAFEPDRDPDEVIRRMEESARGPRCLEVTRAVRDAVIDGQPARAGDAIALIDGRLVASDRDELGALERAARELGGMELLTLYVGAGVGPERASRARETLALACSGAQVEVVEGGQPHYPFIVQAE